MARFGRNAGGLLTVAWLFGLPGLAPAAGPSAVAGFQSVACLVVPSQGLGTSFAGGSSSAGGSEQSSPFSVVAGQNPVDDDAALEASQAQRAQADQQQFDQQQQGLLARESQQDPVNDQTYQLQQPANQLRFDPPRFDPLQMDCSP